MDVTMATFDQQGCLEQPFFLRGWLKAKIRRAGRGQDREKQHENCKFFCRLMRKEFLQIAILHQYAFVHLSRYLAPAYLCQYFSLAFISQVEQMYVQGVFTFILYFFSLSIFTHISRISVFWECLYLYSMYFFYIFLYFSRICMFQE